MSQDSEPRLAALAALCKRQRQGKKHPRFDEEVKSMVRELVADGVSIDGLARAASISSSAVRSWVKGSEPRPKPQQRPVKILSVANGGGAGAAAAPVEGRMVMMIRVADFDVAIYSRDGGQA